jgi:hypothetical protein
MMASFDSKPEGYEDVGTAMASGKKRVARGASALMKIWHRASSQDVSNDNTCGGELTQGVYQIDQSPCLVLVLEQEDRNLIDKDGRILRSNREVVGRTQWLIPSAKTGSSPMEITYLLTEI